MRDLLKPVHQVKQQESQKKWLEIIKDQRTSSPYRSTGKSWSGKRLASHSLVQRWPATSRAPRRGPAMERSHPAKLQMNHPSSTAHAAELF